MRLPSEGRLSKFKEKGFGSPSARDRKFFPHASPGPERFQKGMYSALSEDSPPSKATMKGSCIKYEHFPLLSLRRERMSEVGKTLALCLVQLSGMCQVNTTLPSTNFHGWAAFSFIFPVEYSCFPFFLTFLEEKLIIRHH